MPAAAIEGGDKRQTEICRDSGYRVEETGNRQQEPQAAVQLCIAAMRRGAPWRRVMQDDFLTG